MPGLIVGGTDARFYRERGAVAYGAGLFSPDDELRVVRRSASTATTSGSTSSRSASSTDFWFGIAKDLVG